MRKTSIPWVAASLSIVAILLAYLLPLLSWSTEKTPEIYGALGAAIVAAAALIVAAYYQDVLTREKDAATQRQEQIAETIELCFWLTHFVSELTFIENVLRRMRANYSGKGVDKVDVSLDQFREIISSNLFDDLLPRAKAATKLRPEISGLVAGELYHTYTTVDRIFLLRGANETFQPKLEDLDTYISIVESRQKKLGAIVQLLEEILIGQGALPRFDAA